MSKAAHKSGPAVLPVGTLVKMRFGATDMVATVLEHRGPLGVGGRHIVGVKFLLEGTEDAVQTEVPAEELSVIALPGDPASKRIGVEAIGDAWVGTYTAPDGRVAVVTGEAKTPEQARRAAVRWVEVGSSEASGGSAFGGPERLYEWKPDDRYPGRYSVFRRSRLGDELVREPT